MELLVDAITRVWLIRLGLDCWPCWPVLVPWTPLAAWIIVWLFAVNWEKLRATLAKGGWVGLVLIGGPSWCSCGGNIAPGSGRFDFFGLHRQQLRRENGCTSRGCS